MSKRLGLNERRQPNAATTRKPALDPGLMDQIDKMIQAQVDNQLRATLRQKVSERVDIKVSELKQKYKEEIDRKINAMIVEQIPDIQPGPSPSQRQSKEVRQSFSSQQSSSKITSPSPKIMPSITDSTAPKQKSPLDFKSVKSSLPVNHTQRNLKKDLFKSSPSKAESSAGQSSQTSKKQEVNKVDPNFYGKKRLNTAKANGASSVNSNLNSRQGLSKKFDQNIVSTPSKRTLSTNPRNADPQGRFVSNFSTAKFAQQVEKKAPITDTKRKVKSALPKFDTMKSRSPAARSSSKSYKPDFRVISIKTDVEDPIYENKDPVSVSMKSRLEDGGSVLSVVKQKKPAFFHTLGIIGNGKQLPDPK